MASLSSSSNTFVSVDLAVLSFLLSLLLPQLRSLHASSVQRSACAVQEQNLAQSGIADLCLSRREGKKLKRKRQLEQELNHGKKLRMDTSGTNGVPQNEPKTDVDPDLTDTSGNTVFVHQMEGSWPLNSWIDFTDIGLADFSPTRTRPQQSQAIRAPMDHAPQTNPRHPFSYAPTADSVEKLKSSSKLASFSILRHFLIFSATFRFSEG